ncbi:MAG TPA: hypothetical protein VMT15_12375 [Bryobacteraceae bacterium]|nr:hypothetical protein [Bryobacteraceae bacterium]
MRVALNTTFAATRKEPLAAMLDRVYQAFPAAGLGEPTLRFAFSDAPLEGYVSSVERVLKRFPEMRRFLASNAVMPGLPEVRWLSSDQSDEPVPYATIQAIAAGVPRSFPFHNVSIHFHAPEFGDLAAGISQGWEAAVGVIVSDSWWVNGRQRSLSAVTIVEADASSKKLPAFPESVAAVFAACGKVKKTIQMPFTSVEPQTPPAAANSSGDAAGAVRAIVQDYRARLKEIVERAALPHDLPPASELRHESLGLRSGPMKPTLERVFKPMGYICRGESGTFTLRRRTPSNLTAQLYLDVGTWSRQVTAIFQVFGLGFKASVTIPVAARAGDAVQYPIGDAGRWREIVENLAALVTELDRTLVPKIEQATGPTPEWYQPEV